MEYLQLVPPILVMLVKSPLATASGKLNHVKHLNVGASATSGELEAMVRETIGQDIVIRNCDLYFMLII